MVNALRQSAFENLSLQSSLQEILNLQSQYVIKAHSCFIEHTDANKSTDEGVTFKQTFWVLCVKLEKLTRSTTNFRQDEGNAPDFTFVAETVLSGELIAVTCEAQ
jgi:hypothetical protein